MIVALRNTTTVSIIIGAAGLITGENAAAYYSHSRMGRPLHNCHTGESRYPEGQTRPPTRTDTVCYGLLTSQDAVTAAAVEVVEVVTAELVLEDQQTAYSGSRLLLWDGHRETKAVASSP